MHRTYANDGLVVMSVDVMADELKRQDKVLAFLKEKGAAFPNFIIKDDEKSADAWQAKYKIEYTPATVLFNRAGEWVRLPEDATEKEVEKVVKELLAEK